jgi:hypothetical protein
MVDKPLVVRANKTRTLEIFLNNRLDELTQTSDSRSIIQPPRSGSVYARVVLDIVSILADNPWAPSKHMRHSWIEKNGRRIMASLDPRREGTGPCRISQYQSYLQIQKFVRLHYERRIWLERLSGDGNHRIMLLITTFSCRSQP